MRVVVFEGWAETFHVHAEVLRESSIFLQDALSGRLESPPPEEITLRTIYPFVFRIYVNWLYTDRLCVAIHNIHNTCAERTWFYWQLCYKSADYLQDCTFKDALLGTLIEYMTAQTPYYWHKLPEVIYSSTTRDSPHRKFLIDWAVHTWSEAFLEFMYRHRRHEPTHEEFHLDLIAALVAKGRAARIEHVSSREWLKAIDTCMYHEHTIIKYPRSARCYKTRRET